MPVPERERDMDIYAAEQRARRGAAEQIVAFIRERASLCSFPHQRAPYLDAAEAVENEFVLARFGHGGK